MLFHVQFLAFMTSKPWKRKRKWKYPAGSGASALVGGIATNEITTFLVEARRRKWRKRHQNPKIRIPDKDDEGQRCMGVVVTGKEEKARREWQKLQWNFNFGGRRRHPGR